MSDGLRLSIRQQYIIKACYVNEDHHSADGIINPPYWTSDREDCKALESHLLLRKVSSEGWRLTGLGKDLVRKLRALEPTWVEDIAKDSSAAPYR